MKLTVRFQDVRVMNKKKSFIKKNTFLDSRPTRLSYAGKSSHFYPCHWYKRLMP